MNIKLLFGIFRKIIRNNISKYYCISWKARFFFLIHIAKKLLCKLYTQHINSKKTDFTNSRKTLYSLFLIRSNAPLGYITLLNDAKSFSVRRMLLSRWKRVYYGCHEPFEYTQYYTLRDYTFAQLRWVYIPWKCDLVYELHLLSFLI